MKLKTPNGIAVGAFCLGAISNLVAQGNPAAAYQINVIGGGAIIQQQLTEKENEKRLKFLASMATEMEQLSTADMEAEAKIIAAQIDEGIAKKRKVVIKLIDGKEHTVISKVQVNGYWLTMTCSDGYTTEGEKNVPYKPYEIRIRSSTILSVIIGGPSDLL